MTRGRLLYDCVAALVGNDGFSASACVNFILPNVPDSENVEIPKGFRSWDEVISMVVVAANAQARLERNGPTITENLVKTAPGDFSLTLDDLRSQGLIQIPDGPLNELSGLEMLRACRVNFRDLVNFCRAADKRRDNQQVPSFYMSDDFTITAQWVVFDGGISLSVCDNDSAALTVATVCGSKIMAGANFSRKKNSLGLKSLMPSRLKVTQGSGGKLRVQVKA